MAMALIGATRLRPAQSVVSDVDRAAIGDPALFQNAVIVTER